MKNILLIMFVSLIQTIRSQFGQPTQQQISADDTFYLKWSINPTEKLIRFELDVKTSGWVGIGISPTGKMLDADIYLGYVKKDGTVELSDRIGIGHKLPVLDSTLGGTNDVVDVTGSIQNGRTSISFTRKLVTGDEYDLDINVGVAYNLIFAFRSEGNPETEGTYNYHTRRFSKQIILYPIPSQSSALLGLTDKYLIYDKGNHIIKQENTGTSNPNISDKISNIN